VLANNVPIAFKGRDESGNLDPSEPFIEMLKHQVLPSDLLGVTACGSLDCVFTILGIANPNICIEFPSQ